MKIANIYKKGLVIVTALTLASTSYAMEAGGASELPATTHFPIGTGTLLLIGVVGLMGLLFGRQLARIPSRTNPNY
jgi:uncharacterized membrane protein YkvI